MIEKTRVRKKLIKFALVGLVGTGLDFTVFTLSLMLGFGPTIGRSLGYSAGTLWAFFVNRRWVFNSKGNLSRFIPFSLTYLFSGSVAVVIQSLGPAGSEATGGVFLTYGVSVAIGALINFLSLRYVVFRD